MSAIQILFIQEDKLAFIWKLMFIIGFEVLLIYKSNCVFSTLLLFVLFCILNSFNWPLSTVVSIQSRSEIL